MKPSIALFTMIRLGAIACSKSERAHPKILVSPKGLVHNLGVTVKASADSAGKELSAEVIWISLDLILFLDFTVIMM